MNQTVKFSETQDDEPGCVLCVGGKAEVWRPREGWYCKDCDEEHLTCDDIGCVCWDCGHCDMIHIQDDGTLECDLCGCTTTPSHETMTFWLENRVGV